MNNNIVCIDNKSRTGEYIPNLDKLTIGKIYAVKYGNINRGVVIVENDDGRDDMFNSNRFLTVQEYRELKINELIK